MWAEIYFALSQFTCLILTDGQTDKKQTTDRHFLMANTALRSMQCGKMRITQIIKKMK